MKRLTQNNGFSLMETVVAVAIFVVMLSGLAVIITSGQNSWFNADTQIDLQESMRKTFAKVSSEVRQSSSTQLQVNKGSGGNGSDTIVFSIPVLCETGMDLMGTGTSIQYWGAPLTWGCTSSSCMDGDNDCTTVEYSQVRYMIDGSNQLVRQVLDGVSSVVQTDIMAQDIIGMDITITAGGHINIDVTAQQSTATNRTITATTDVNIHMRN